MKNLLINNWKTSILASTIFVGVVLLGFNALTSGSVIILGGIAAITLFISKDAK
jgi:hypothetical protein